MAASKKSGNSLYKKLFFISLALLVILGILYINKTSNNKKVTINELEQKIKSQNEEIKILNEIFLAESNWISGGELAKAIKKLEDIDKAYSSSKIKNRIKAFKKMQEELASDTLSIQQYKVRIRSRNRTIDQLKKQNDSLNDIVDDKLNQLEDENESLKSSVQKKQKALNRKENIQVITFKSSKGDEVHYLGEVKNGKANGGGTGIWRTGSIYRGQWKNNKRHGKGIFEWADGQKYEGDFKNDVRSGEGTYYWPSGERYEGEFKNNRREGEGTLYDPDGNVSFDGQWKNDEPVVK